MADETKISGAFYESLIRNNAKIRQDRAAAIQESADLCYKRYIEDLEIAVKRLCRDRDNMLDMSPTTATSLIIASDFNDKEFVEKDIAIGIELRNIEIKLEIAKERYKELFTAGE